ncbi:MAG: hypothetical protein ABSG83_01005 [Roseiarcus sp.]|jgi:hypothetical protein
MPGWLSILIGLLAGFVLVAGAIHFAFAPHLQAPPPKSRRPASADTAESEGARHAAIWSGTVDESHHSDPDGHAL